MFVLLSEHFKKGNGFSLFHESSLRCEDNFKAPSIQKRKPQTCQGPIVSWAPRMFQKPTEKAQPENTSDFDLPTSQICVYIIHD